MRILHIAELVKGGLETYIKEVVAFQVQAQQINKVHLLISNKPSDSFEIKDVDIQFYKYERSLGLVIPAIVQINKIINDLSPDIIHIHSTFAGVFVRLLYFAKRKKVKIVYCSHGWAFLRDTSNFKKKIFAFIERILAYKTDLIINVSENEYKQSMKYGLPPEKSVYIYSGVKEQETINVNNFNYPFKLNANKINVLFVGRFDQPKGLDILLEVHKKYKFPHIQFILIGDSIIDKEALQIPADIINVGWVEQNQMDYFYQICDVVIMPSRWEAFGLVAVEAMRNRKPVIASNAGALPELVSNGVNGYIFDLSNLKSLETILLNLDKGKLKLMGENGYRIYKQKFDSRLMNEQIIVQYVKLFKI